MQCSRGTRTQFWVRIPEKFLGTRLPETPDPALFMILEIDKYITTSLSQDIFKNHEKYT